MTAAIGATGHVTTPAFSIGDLVLTAEGIYRWAGESKATHGNLTVTHDFRFNSVPTVFAFADEVAPAALESNLNLADTRISITENKNAPAGFGPKFTVRISGGLGWESGAYYAQSGLLKAARVLAIRDWHEAGCPPVTANAAPRKEWNEIPAEPVLEDFEVGDKVFSKEEMLDNRYTDIATVVSVESHRMWVRIEHAWAASREISSGFPFDSPYHLRHWHKLPDETLIKVGDTLSTSFPGYLSVPNGREFFIVKKIEPGKTLSLKSLENSYHTLKFGSDEYENLDQYLQHWQIEG